MAELIPTNRYTAVLGPIKMELIRLAGTVVVADSNGNPSSTTQSGATDADTVKTLMQNPEFVTAQITSDAISDVVSFNVAISTPSSSDPGKTLTLNHAGLANDDVVLQVWGF